MNTLYKNTFSDVVSEFSIEQQNIINNDTCHVVAVNCEMTPEFFKKYLVPYCVLQAHENTHQKIQSTIDDHLSYIDVDVKDLYFYDGLCWNCLVKYVQNETGKIFPAIGEDGDTCIAYEYATITINPDKNIVTKYVNVIENGEVCTKQYNIPYIIPQNDGCPCCHKCSQKIDVSKITFAKLHNVANNIVQC